jgi:hypothetical protein
MPSQAKTVGFSPPQRKLRKSVEKTKDMQNKFMNRFKKVLFKKVVLGGIILHRSSIKLRID